MKVKINQLYEQQNENNADFIIQQLKKENCKLHQLINKLEYAEMELLELRKEKEVNICLYVCLHDYTPWKHTHIITF